MKACMASSQSVYATLSLLKSGSKLNLQLSLCQATGALLRVGYFLQLEYILASGLSSFKGRLQVGQTGFPKHARLSTSIPQTRRPTL